MMPFSPASNRMALDDSPSSFHSSPDSLDFQIERSHHRSRKVHHTKLPKADYEAQQAFQSNISNLLSATRQQNCVSGHIPFDAANLVLFFRSKSGLTHSLNFPIDVEIDTPPALDVLIAACKPHQSLNPDDFTERESLYYPQNLPVTTTLDISNHPILEAVRNTLFPILPQGHYLTALRDKLEIIVTGGRMLPQASNLRNDGRVATILITLPIRHRGGALIVRDAQGRTEQFHGKGGKGGDLEWTAFTTECEYEMVTVSRGCRATMSYAIYLKSFGPAGLMPDPLINPSDQFLDLLSPILNATRGRRIAFYLQHEHNVSPADMLADSLVPMLKGGDSVLYHALKLYKLTPELHWTAGGYIWPVDRNVEWGIDTASLLKSPSSRRTPFGVLNGQRSSSATRRPYSMYSDVQDEADVLRMRIQESGAVPLAEEDILVLSDPWASPSAAVPGKERLPFVSNTGELEKLVVNVLMVVFVP